MCPCLWHLNWTLEEILIVRGSERAINVILFNGFHVMISHLCSLQILSVLLAELELPFNGNLGTEGQLANYGVWMWERKTKR